MVAAPRYLMNRSTANPPPLDGDEDSDDESDLRRVVVLALACREDGGDAAVAAILAEFPDLAPIVRRRMAILAELGLLDSTRVTFRYTGDR
jgi:hypothetical protein